MPATSTFALLATILLTLSFPRPVSAANAPTVRTLRLPDGGVQPQAAVGPGNVVHIIYLTGDPSKSDIFYMRSADGGQSFSKPIRVNSQPGSAIAMGTVRGAHLAIGRGGRVHVAWMGSATALPKGPGKSAPMLYARSTADGSSFEPQRNVIDSKPGLDGGGSVAADQRGNVYVAWHAPGAPGEGEQSRRVWLARSNDDGKTFAHEQSITSATGACGCCGMRLFADHGSLYALYRTANQQTQRDMTLVRFDPRTAKSESTTVGPMRSGVCVMSTAALAAGPNDSVLAAWETNGQINWARIINGKEIAGQAVAGQRNNPKHPALASNAAGQTLLVWTENTGWNRGGSIAWQIFDSEGRAIRASAGNTPGLPAWGAPAAFSRADGSFTIVY
ncbi:MAG TPA: sialidase family protein [Tepidisphaeraceae bacterium]|nr:sialidase family protein [Tepidisphaeraceae bacterium]